MKMLLVQRTLAYTDTHWRHNTAYQLLETLIELHRTDKHYKQTVYNVQSLHCESSSCSDGSMREVWFQ